MSFENKRKQGEIYDFLTYREELCLLWQEYRLGGFKQSLMDTIAKAPKIHRARLAVAYPDEVEAIRRYEEDEGFWEAIAEKVKAARLGYGKDEDGEEAEI